MRNKLSVLVQIDLDGRQVTLAVTGSLTAANQQVLVPLVARALIAFPEAEVTVDLHGTQEAESSAIDILRWSLEAVQPATGPVRVTAPLLADGDRPEAA
jgi:hypothetical protein